MPVLRPDFPDHSSAFSREQERRRKHGAILSAAAKRFNAEGFSHARLEDVAADLGLTKTGICYYYASKDDLAEAVFRVAAEALHDAVSAAASSPGNAASRLQRLFDLYADQIRLAAKGERVHLASMNDFHALPEAVRAHVGERASACVKELNGMVAAWIDETGAPLGRPEPASFLLLELLDWMGQHQVNDRDGFGVDAIHAVVSDLLLNGLISSSGLIGAPAPLPLGAGDTLAIFDRDARNRMKREAFLKAGTRFFNQKGFGGTSLAEVASALGVTRGAFYYHIADKEQFLDQCIDRSLQIVERVLDAADDAELAPLERVHSVLSELIYQQAVGVEPLIRPGMAGVLPPARQRRHRTRLQTITRRLGDMVSEGMASGDIRAVDPHVIEAMLVGIMFFNGGYTLAAAHSLSSWSASEEPRTATRDYLYLVIHGMAGRS